jgi:hypothetical protein
VRKNSQPSSAGRANPSSSKLRSGNSSQFCLWGIRRGPLALRNRLQTEIKQGRTCYKKLSVVRKRLVNVDLRAAVMERLRTEVRSRLSRLRRSERGSQGQQQSDGNFRLHTSNLSTHIGRATYPAGFIFHLTEIMEIGQMNIQQTGHDSSMSAQTARNHQIRAAGSQSYIAQLVPSQVIAVHNSRHTPGGTSHALFQQQFTCRVCGCPPGRNLSRVILPMRPNTRSSRVAHPLQSHRKGWVIH